MSAAPLLDIRDLVVSVASERGTVRVVDGVSLAVPRGQTVGLVGESGSGKSVTALSALGLLSRALRVESGSIALDGTELARAPERVLCDVRGRRIGMVFQEPMTSLNPVFTVGAQVVEAIRAHRAVSKAEARARAIQLLGRVGIAAPAERMDAYPHQLSGGMRQRVMIAIALACDPELLIADEPTTALDVTIQAQILDLLADLQRELGMSVLLITHDLGVVAEHTHALYVMYAGKVVERGPTRAVLDQPQHPYTRGLLASVPSRALGQRRLPTIPGLVPDLAQLPPGCRFRARCPLALDACAQGEPPLVEVASARLSACLRAPLPPEAP